MIVDPSLYSRMVLKSILATSGYSVCCEVASGKEALQKFEKVRPDMVLVEAQMPDMDGVEAAKILTEERIAPVLLLSAYSQQELVQRARQAGVAGYLVKPFRESDLTPAIEVVLARFSEFRALEREVASLGDALETRKLVDRAKGILMDTQGLNENDAFRRIQKMSMNNRKSMRSVAEVIILAHQVSEQ